MTKEKTGKLSHEILGITAACVLTGVAFYWFALYGAIALAENYCWQRDLELSQGQWDELYLWAQGGSTVTAVALFLVLYLVLLGQRLSYIRQIIQGIQALREHREDCRIPLEGNNELTRLAESIHSLSRQEQELRKKEKAMQQEREALIRSLSHDIRTPLTSILSYTELIQAGEVQPPAVREQIGLIHRKALQIRDLTEVLLSGGGQRQEYADGRLLMLQLAQEFAEPLEEKFYIDLDLQKCPAFRGRFDVRDLQRIFDNLSSNVEKYADPAQKVRLEIHLEGTSLVICQENAVARREEKPQGYRVGLNSIRRIAQSYGGSLEISESPDSFRATVVLSDF